MAKYSEAQNKWTQAYIKNNYETICVRVPKGKKETYTNLAKSKNKSMNQLIIDLLEKELE